MTGRQRLGVFLVLAGFVLLATAAFFWRGDADRRAGREARRSALEDSARGIRDEIVKASLRLRAFHTSLPTMPDSARRNAGVKIMETTTGFNKKIRRLELAERDVKLKITALTRDSTRERERERARAKSVAVGALVAIVMGAVLIVPRRPRVGA